MNLMRRIGMSVAIAATAAISMGTAPVAMANVFNPADWTASGGNSASVSTTANSVTLNFYNGYFFCAGCYYPTWNFTTTAPATGTLGFDYTEAANGAYFLTSGYLDLIDVTSSTSELLNNYGGLFTVSGTGSLAVTAGDTILIQAQLGNFDSQPFVNGTVTLTNWSGVGVPEPMSIALLGAGLAGLGLIRRKRA